jgi:hypothetical protein
MTKPRDNWFFLPLCIPPPIVLALVAVYGVKMRKLLQSFVIVGAVSAGLVSSRPAQAQTGDGVYAAPGHLITFPHRQPPPPPRPSEVVSPILPRFWHDEVKGTERASEFYRFMSQYLKYPEAAVKAGVVGRVYVRLTVGPNGRVNTAHVVNHQVASVLAAQPTAPETAAATAALDAETLRIFLAARFQVAKMQNDTVTVSASFQIQ